MNETEELRAKYAALKRAARRYLSTVGAAIKSGEFNMSGSRDMAHFVRSAMQELDTLAFDRDERRPTGLERLHEKQDDELLSGWKETDNG